MPRRTTTATPLAPARLVMEHLKEWGGRVLLPYPPLDAPECNPVGRVWGVI